MREKISITLTARDDWVCYIDDTTVEEAISILNGILVKYGKDARLVTETCYEPSIGNIEFTREETDDEYKIRMANEDKIMLDAIAYANKMSAKAKAMADKEEEEERELLATLMVKYGVPQK